MLAARWRKTRFIVKIVGDAAWEWAVNRGATYLLINDFQKQERTGRAGRLHRRQVQVCEAADRVIVPSRYLAGLVQGWGIPSERVAVVYNGSDFEPADISKEEARKAIGVAGNVILSVGRLVPWKGFRMLIKVMPQLLQLNQFTRLVIVGDGPLAGDLRAMARTLGLERKVIVVGSVSRDELRTYLAAADVFVLNTGYEGFSHQLLEALRAGVPVVTTTAGGNRELITQGETGFMVKYNDEFNLVEATKMLWSNEQVRRKFVANGRKAAERFSVDRMLSETINVLTSS
jgi:glycosyltransferase involved in cell wall biosynthesis